MVVRTPTIEYWRALILGLRCSIGTMSLRNALIGPIAVLFAGTAMGQHIHEYVPGQQGIPLLYRKGQVRADLIGQWSERGYRILFTPIRGLAIKAAYAVDDRWGLVGSFDHHRMDLTVAAGRYNSNGSAPVFTYYDYQGNWTYGEIGAGRYRLFANNWIGEVYGLLGYGITENEWPIGSRKHARKFGLSAQANWGRAIGFFEYAIANRLRYLRLSETWSTTRSGVIDVTRGLLVWEPALVVRGGWKYVRLSLQAGFSADVVGTIDTRADLNVGLGVNVFFRHRTSSMSGSSAP